MPGDNPVFPPSKPPLVPLWVPGMVDIEFRQGVWPKVVPGKGGKGPQIVSMQDKSPWKKQEEKFDMSNVNNLLSAHVLLKLKSAIEISKGESLRLQRSSDKKKIKVSNLGHFIIAQFRDDAILDNIIGLLRKDPTIVKVERVPRLKPPDTGRVDPKLGRSEGDGNCQWYIYKCHVDKAWKKASGKNVVIADLDWGFMTDHEDLKNRIDPNHARNFLDNPPTSGINSVNQGIPRFREHGNAVLGYCGAEKNGKGIIGIAYQAHLWPIIGGNSDSQDWVNAIYWVSGTRYRRKPKVIILEAETGAGAIYEMRIVINAIITTVVNQGIVVCVPAGNGGHDVGDVTDRDVPINDPNSSYLSGQIPDTGSIVVGATDFPLPGSTMNSLSSTSNFGNRVNIYAPGDQPYDVTCGAIDNTTYSDGLGGTSSATAKVAGIAALMLEIDPFLTSQEIRNILKKTGNDSISTNRTGQNTSTEPRYMVNAEAAVNEAIRSKTFWRKFKHFILKIYWWIFDNL
jgi:subtilisin family serine protease